MSTDTQRDRHVYVRLATAAVFLIGFGLGAFSAVWTVAYYPYERMPEWFVHDWSPYELFGVAPSVLGVGALAIVLGLLIGYKIDRDYASIDRRIRYGIDDEQ